MPPSDMYLPIALFFAGVALLAQELKRAAIWGAIVFGVFWLHSVGLLRWPVG